jgi:hypothetical protein
VSFAEYRAQEPGGAIWRFPGSTSFEVAPSPAASPLTFIHQSAWNRNSRKFTCRILHKPALFAPGSPRLVPSAPSLEERVLIQR